MDDAKMWQAAEGAQSWHEVANRVAQAAEEEARSEVPDAMQERLDAIRRVEAEMDVLRLIHPMPGD